ncbi:unnamed protein product, partial [Amoebophrya sp. A25]|eukprot:GSA25T00019909001.1
MKRHRADECPDLSAARGRPSPAVLGSDSSSSCVSGVRHGLGAKGPSNQGVCRPASPQRISEKSSAVYERAGRLLNPGLHSCQYLAGTGDTFLLDETLLLDEAAHNQDTLHSLTADDEFFLDGVLLEQSQEQQRPSESQSLPVVQAASERDSVTASESQHFMRKIGPGRPKASMEDRAEFWKNRCKIIQQKEKRLRNRLEELKSHAQDDAYMRKLRLQMARGLADSAAAVRAYSKDVLLLEDAVARTSLASYKAVIVERIFKENRAWIKSILDLLPNEHPTFLRMGHDEFRAHFKKMGTATLLDRAFYWESCTIRAMQVDQHATQSRNSSAQLYLVNFWVPSFLRQKVGLLPLSELRYLCELHALARKNSASVAVSMVAMFEAMCDDLLKTLEKCVGEECEALKRVLVHCIVSDNLEANALAVRMSRKKMRQTAKRMGLEYIVVYLDLECCPHKMNLVSSFAMLGNDAALAKRRGQLEIWEGEASANVDVGR